MNLLNKFNSFWDKLSPNIRGFIFILIASATFPIMGTTVKYLTSELHPFQIAFFRCFFGFMIIIPLIIKKNPSKILHTKRYPMHVLRGLLGVGAMMAGFTALSMLPLATAVTLGFTRILFLVPLAMLLLGEKPGFLRIFCILIGFLGVIIIIDPSNDNNITYFSASLALLGAFLVSCVKLSVKSLSSSESTLTIQFYYGIISTTALIVPCYLFWTPLNSFQIFLILFAAIVGTIAQMLTIWGLKLGATTLVMPADYTRLIFAGIYGFILFNEIPYLNEVIGSFIIIIATMIILYLDNIKKTIK